MLLSTFYIKLTDLQFLGPAFSLRQSDLCVNKTFINNLTRWTDEWTSLHDGRSSSMLTFRFQDRRHQWFECANVEAKMFRENLAMRCPCLICEICTCKLCAFFPKIYIFVLSGFYCRRAAASRALAKKLRRTRGELSAGKTFYREWRLKTPIIGYYLRSNNAFIITRF